MAIPPQAPAGATPAIEAVWREVQDRWGSRVTSWGVSVCRRIAGSTTWSQHAWGNAWDIHASTALMDRVADFLRSPAMRPHVAQVLWRVPDHYDHIHVSGRPMRDGVPPCALGQQQYQQGEPGWAPGPLQEAAELGLGESWAPAARTSARMLLVASDKLAGYAEQVARLREGM